MFSRTSDETFRRIWPRQAQIAVGLGSGRALAGKGTFRVLSRGWLFLAGLQADKPSVPSRRPERPARTGSAPSTP